MTEVSAYDRLRLDDAQLCALLTAGRSRRELQAVFGPGDYALLTALAQRAARTKARPGAPVYLLPGIMGTQLGLARTAPLPPDLLWIDPQDIIAGRLRHLRLGDGATAPDRDQLVTLGAIPYTYLALQLRLRAAGFTVIMHQYDWRRSLVDLAAQFAARVRADGAGTVMIVAHSMGGLIARAAMALPGMQGVQRLIALGVPQCGSFGAVQALRGTYPVVRRLAALDRLHDAETLATQIFGSLPSLYQLLPPQGDGAQPDLHDPQAWPHTGPRPDATLLQRARGFIASLPPPDSRYCAIAGTRQRTITSVRVAEDDFHYTIGDAGDGSVPLESAALAGCANYYLRCEHSALPRSASVARALRDLLLTGSTATLASVPAASSAHAVARRQVTVSDQLLRSTWTGKTDWPKLTPAARREYLNQLNQPPPHYAAPRARRSIARLNTARLQP